MTRGSAQVAAADRGPANVRLQNKVFFVFSKFFIFQTPKSTGPKKHIFQM